MPQSLKLSPWGDGTPDAFKAAEGTPFPYEPSAEQAPAEGGHTMFMAPMAIGMSSSQLAPLLRSRALSRRDRFTVDPANAAAAIGAEVAVFHRGTGRLVHVGEIEQVIEAKQLVHPRGIPLWFDFAGTHIPTPLDDYDRPTFVICPASDADRTAAADRSRAMELVASCISGLQELQRDMCGLTPGLCPSPEGLVQMLHQVSAIRRAAS